MTRCDVVANRSSHSPNGPIKKKLQDTCGATDFNLPTNCQRYIRLTWSYIEHWVFSCKRTVLKIGCSDFSYQRKSVYLMWQSWPRPKPPPGSTMRQQTPHTNHSIHERDSIPSNVMITAYAMSSWGFTTWGLSRESRNTAEQENIRPNSINGYSDCSNLGTKSARMEELPFSKCPKKTRENSSHVWVHKFRVRK